MSEHVCNRAAGAGAGSWVRASWGYPAGRMHCQGVTEGLWCLKLTRPSRAWLF